MNNEIGALYFKNIFENLKEFGSICSPRGMKIIELENFTYEFPPYVRFCNFKSRKLNLQYIKDEFKWYLKGDLHDLSITEKAKMWKALVTPGGTINSNYGHYIFGMGNFYRVAQGLIKDKDSRRESITILDNTHCFSNPSDLPCTYSLNFRIRNNRLNMSVCMRSQDSIYGMGNDAPCFSFIHEMLYVYLKDTYKDLKYGNYFHYANSFHIYERHFEMLKKITGEDEYISINCPEISCKEEVEFLIKHDFTNIPENFEFTKWLNE